MFAAKDGRGPSRPTVRYVPSSSRSLLI